MNQDWLKRDSDVCGPLVATSEYLNQPKRSVAEVENERLKARIQAATRRLGDLKALHSRWYDGGCGLGVEQYAKVIREMEQIAYSALCYLEGAPGLYLPKQGNTCPCPWTGDDGTASDCISKGHCGCDEGGKS